jgi:hypothetical protein
LVTNALAYFAGERALVVTEGQKARKRPNGL